MTPEETNLRTLLKSTMELREALVVAMLIVTRDETMTRFFELELRRRGIDEGFGPRANDIIEAAEAIVRKEIG